MHPAQRHHLLHDFRRGRSMHRLARQCLIWLLHVSLLVAICGCRPAADRPQTAHTKLVQLQLNWIPDAQHGGFYAALEGGHYAAEGLAVEITPGGPGTPVIPKVAMGRCDFAVANADQVLLARDQGADIVALFAAMQDSPRCLMVHASSGIESFAQLRDLTLALGDGKAFAEFLKQRLRLENVRFVSYAGSVAKFLVDEDYAQQGYVFSEPLVAEAQGGDPRVLMVSTLGFNPYSSVVVTRRELWEEDPQRVRQFVQATRAGWESYLKSPEAANAAILKVNREMDASMLRKSVDTIRPLCTTDGKPLGSMTRERWQTLRQQLIELKLLSPDGPSAESAFVNP